MMKKDESGENRIKKHCGGEGFKKRKTNNFLMLKSRVEMERKVMDSQGQSYLVWHLFSSPFLASLAY